MNDNNLREKLHNTVQHFLTKFQKNTGQERLPFDFKSNPNVHCIEPYLPDLWLKTRKPFDKNECFVNEKLLKENLFPK